MFVYGVALVLGRLLALLPFPILYLCSDFLAWLLGQVMAYRRQVVEDNLAQAFPEKSAAEREQIKKDFYRNFADILVESIKSLGVSQATMRRRMRLRNPEVFGALQQAGKGVIMVMGHQSNFEWTAMCAPLMVDQACFAVYHPLKNRRFNRLIVRIREQFGLKLFRMKNTYPFMLNNTVPTPLYVFMADQSPHKGKIKYRTRFLNRQTPVHLGVENLARACDLGVVFIEIERVKRGYYEVVAHLLFADAPSTAPYEITDRHVQALEASIRRSPHTWLWSHKRWKHA